MSTHAQQIAVKLDFPHEKIRVREELALIIYLLKKNLSQHLGKYLVAYRQQALPYPTDQLSLEIRALPSSLYDCCISVIPPNHQQQQAASPHQKVAELHCQTQIELNFAITQYIWHQLIPDIDIPYEITHDAIELSPDLRFNYSGLTFIHSNTAYQSTLSEISHLTEQIQRIHLSQASNSAASYKQSIIEKRVLLKEKQEELQVLLRHLFATSHKIAQTRTQQMHEYAARAIKHYSTGDARAALRETRELDQLIDQTLLHYKHHKSLAQRYRNETISLLEALRIRISLLILNAASVMKDSLHAIEQSYLLLFHASETILLDRETRSADYFEYAYFLHGLNDFPKALDYTRKAIKLLGKQPLRTHHLARCHTQLASIYRAQKQYSKAQCSYQQALDLYKQLAQSNPLAYRPAHAALCMNCGIYYSDTEELDHAEKHYLRALKLYRSLTDSHPSKYLSDLSRLLNNLAMHYIKGEKLNKVEALLSESISLQQKSLRLQPLREDATQQLAWTYGLLGRYWSDRRQDQRSAVFYKHAITLYKELSESNPYQYLHDLASSLDALATAYGDSPTKSFKDIESLYVEALRIREILFKSDAKAFCEDVCQTLHNLGFFYKENHRYHQAIEHIDRALNIYNSLPQQQLAPHALDLADLLELYGEVAVQSGQRELAREKLLESLALFETIDAAKHPHLLPKLASVYNSLANNSDAEQAEHYYIQSLRIKRRLLNKRSAGTHHHEAYASSLYNLAEHYSESAQLTKATRYYRSAIRIYKRLSKSDKGIYEEELGSIYHALGWMHSQQDQYRYARHNYDHARSYYESGIAPRRRHHSRAYMRLMFDTATLEYRLGSDDLATELYLLTLQFIRKSSKSAAAFDFTSELLITYHDLATLYDESACAAHRRAAKRYYKKVWEIYQTLSNEDITRSQEKHPEMINNLATHYLLNKSPRRAILLYERNLRLYEIQCGDTLYSQENEDLLLLHTHLALAYQEEGRDDEAIGCYKRMIATYDRIDATATYREYYRIMINNLIEFHRLRNQHNMACHYEQYLESIS